MPGNLVQLGRHEIGHVVPQRHLGRLLHPRGFQGALAFNFLPLKLVLHLHELLVQRACLQQAAPVLGALPRLRGTGFGRGEKVRAHAGKIVCQRLGLGRDLLGRGVTLGTFLAHQGAIFVFGTVGFHDLGAGLGGRPLCLVQLHRGDGGSHRDDALRAFHRGVVQLLS